MAASDSTQLASPPITPTLVDTSGSDDEATAELPLRQQPRVVGHFNDGVRHTRLNPASIAIYCHQGLNRSPMLAGIFAASCLAMPEDTEEEDTSEEEGGGRILQQPNPHDIVAGAGSGSERYNSV